MSRLLEHKSYTINIPKLTDYLYSNNNLSEKKNHGNNPTHDIYKIINYAGKP